MSIVAGECWTNNQKNNKKGIQVHSHHVFREGMRESSESRIIACVSCVTCVDFKALFVLLMTDMPGRKFLFRRTTC